MSNIRHLLQLKDFIAMSIAKSRFLDRHNVDISDGASEITLPLFNSNIVLSFRLFSYDSFTVCCLMAGICTLLTLSELRILRFQELTPAQQRVDNGKHGKPRDGN